MVLVRRIRVLVIGAVLEIASGARGNAAEPLHIRAANHDFQRLQLTATATPSDAADSRSIQIDVRLTNPTRDIVKFPALDSFFSEIGVTVKTKSGDEIKADHDVIYRPFFRVRYFTFVPGSSIEDTNSLYNVGFTLGPGTYVVTIAYFSMAENLQPVFAIPITVTITG